MQHEITSLGENKSIIVRYQLKLKSSHLLDEIIFRLDEAVLLSENVPKTA